MGKDDPKKCSNGGIALSLFASIFMFGAVCGLILYLTDGGGTTTTLTPAPAPTSSLDDDGGLVLAHQCKVGFWGSNCTACASCGLHGTCNGTGTTGGTGTCVCATGFAGDDCTMCATGFWGTNCVACHTCSGHGTCDGSGTSSGTGACVCAPGFDGTSCDQCAPGHYGTSCTPCTAVCGTHGSCNDGVSNDGACACDLGWTGSTCNACDSDVAWPTSLDDCILGPGLDPGTTGVVTGVACGDHGTLQSLGDCTCDGGWSTLDCSEEVCASNEWGPSCTACSCNGHGECDGAGTKTGTGGCRCTGNYAGAACNACKRGFTGLNCSIQCQHVVDGSNPIKICNHHGACVGDGLMTNTGTGACTCDEGWTGDRCETGAMPSACVTGPSNEVCNTHGTCGVGGTCTCDEGYDNVTQCETLLPGWAFVSGNVAECPGGASAPCNGHGTCSVSTGECDCDEGYTGAMCNDCAFGHWQSNTNPGTPNTCDPCAGRSVNGGVVETCNNHGECKASDGTCACQPGWSGGSCETCASGFWGSRCWSCPRSKGSSSACSGHGTCDGSGFTNGTGACHCADYFVGTACGTCQAGRYGSNCDACLADANGHVCSNRGSCDGDGTSTGTGRCNCLDGATGNLCELCTSNRYGSSCVFCPGMTEDGQACSGHGTCDGEGTRTGSGTCVCEEGWRGATCSDPVPCAELKECSNHGTCGALGGTCFCNVGWTGKVCDTVVENPNVCSGGCEGLNEKCVNGQCTVVAPPTDPCATETCNNHGMCANGVCLCAPEYTGEKCGTAVSSGNQYHWTSTAWSKCSKNCGTDGIRERTVRCENYETQQRALDSLCTGTVESFENCHRFECQSIVGVGGIILLMPHSYINTTAAHVASFEDTVEFELGSATNVPKTRFRVVLSHDGGYWTAEGGDGDGGGSDGRGWLELTYVRFIVLPPTTDSADTVETIITSLNEQSKDAESKLRTDGSFVRRVVPTDGALNVVPVKTLNPTDSTSSTADSQIDAVDPFVDINQPPSTPSTEEGAGAAPNGMHGGIAGIIVASVFLGIGALVGLTWFVVHRTSAGSAYKHGREKKRSTMKIQLTASEKSEMGMVTNPNLANAKTQEAIQLVQQAVVLDEQRQFQQAIVLYESAVERFKVVMTHERNAQYKFSLAKKMDKYMTRIKELKQHLKKNGGGHGGNGGKGGNGGHGGHGGGRQSGGAHSMKPARGNKSSGLARAPQVV